MLMCCIIAKFVSWENIAEIYVKNHVTSAL